MNSDKIITNLKIFIAEKLDGKSLKTLLKEIYDEVSISNARYLKARIQFEFSIYTVLPDIIAQNDYFTFFTNKIPAKFIFPIVCESQLSSCARLLLNKKKVHIPHDLYAIKVYYLRNYHLQNVTSTRQRGASLPLVLTTLSDLRNSIFLASNRSRYTLSHEISHILLNALHDNAFYVPRDNIFSSPATVFAKNILGKEYKQAFSEYKGIKVHPACNQNQIAVMRKNAELLSKGLQ